MGPGVQGRRARFSWRALGRRLRPRVRLKITFEGRIFILLTFGVGLAAINTGNNMLFLVLGFMLSVITISGVLSELALLRLEITRRLPVLPWAGEVCPIEISVRNRKSFSSFCIEVQDIATNFTVDRRCFFLKVGGKKTQSTAYHCVFPRRGVYRFSGMTVMTRFPFGLFSKAYAVDAEDELVVAPRRVHVKTELDEPVRLGEVTGGARTDRNDPEPSFLRPFFPGDDPRRINWKLSAHRARLIVAEGMEHFEKHVNVLFDDMLRPAAGGDGGAGGAPRLRGPAAADPAKAAQERFEREVDLAASTAHAFAAEGYGIWFGTRRKVIGPITPQQVPLVVRELATIAPAGEGASELPSPPAGPTVRFNCPRREEAEEGAREAAGGRNGAERRVAP